MCYLKQTVTLGFILFLFTSVFFAFSFFICQRTSGFRGVGIEVKLACVYGNLTGAWYFKRKLYGSIVCVHKDLGWVGRVETNARGSGNIKIQYPMIWKRSRHGLDCVGTLIKRAWWHALRDDRVGDDITPANINAWEFETAPDLGQFRWVKTDGSILMLSSSTYRHKRNWWIKPLIKPISRFQMQIQD